MRDGKVILKDLFIYFYRNNEGGFSTTMVQYTKNRSLKTGYYTGTVLLTFAIESTLKTICIGISNNQFVSVSNPTLNKNKIFDAQTANRNFPAVLKSSEICVDETLFYFECPPGLTFNQSTGMCDWGNSGCPGFYQDACGNIINADSQTNSSCSGSNINSFSGNILGGEVWISFQSLVLIAASTGSLALILAWVPSGVTQVIATGLGITGIWAGTAASLYPNGIVISYYMGFTIMPIPMPIPVAYYTFSVRGQ